MAKDIKLEPEFVSRNNLSTRAVPEGDDLAAWVEAYFALAVTTAESSRKVQRRDLATFLAFMAREVGHTQRPAWTPRLSRAFVNDPRSTLNAQGRRRFADVTINRILAHLKTFAKWVHSHRPFPLGDPLKKLAALTVPTVLAVERALNPSEERQLLDAADLLLEVGGRSRDRRAHGAGPRPRRKGYRPYRNRALVYTLIGTGMRRAALGRLNGADVDFDRRLVTVTEKGGVRQSYHIRREALEAIRDYLEHERCEDEAKWASPALFLTAATNAKGDGRLSVRSLNQIWNDVAQAAGLTGKTPHAARHAMGKRIMRNTGNLAAVQRQLGHRNAAYTLQYARPSFAEMEEAIGEK
jgi:integrase